MAAREIKTTIKLDGATRFKQDLKSARTEMAVLKAETKASVTALKAQGDAMGAAQAQAEGLKAQQEQQAEIVKALEQALKDATEKYGENSAKVQEYRTQLANAQIALTNITTAASDAALEAENLSNSMGDAGDAVESAGNDGANGFEGIEDALSQIASSTAFSAMCDGLDLVKRAANFAYDAIKQVYDMVNQSSEWADDLLTLSITSGIDTQTLQQMEYASRFVDTEVDTIIGSMNRLRSNMDNTKKMEDLATLLGVSAYGDDGQLLDAMTYFNLIMARAAELKIDLTKDTAAANLFMDVFGKGAAELQPLINGWDLYGEKMEEAQEKGYVLSDDELENLGDYNDGLEALTVALETLERVWASTLAPVFDEFNNGLTDVIGDITEWLRDADVASTLEGVATTIGTVMGMIGDMVSEDMSFGDLLDTITEWLSGDAGYENLQTVLTSFLDSVFTTITGFVSAMYDDGENGINMTDAIQTATENLIETMFKSIAESFIHLLDNGNPDGVQEYIAGRIKNLLDTMNPMRIIFEAFNAMFNPEEIESSGLISNILEYLKSIFGGVIEGIVWEVQKTLDDIFSFFSFLGIETNFYKGDDTPEQIAEQKAHEDELTEGVRAWLLDKGYELSIAPEIDEDSDLVGQVQTQLDGGEYSIGVTAIVTDLTGLTGGSVADYSSFLSRLPGHADGLESVPYDNYVARLHKGETVLTASEAKVYRQGGISESSLDSLANKIVRGMSKIGVNIDGRKVGEFVAPTVNEIIGGM